MNKNILVVGGAGYIGSHTVLALIKNGYNPIIIDNFSKSNRKNIDKIIEKTGYTLKVIEHDITQSFNDIDIPPIESLIHFAAFKAVGESVINPLDYYSNNVGGIINLLKWSKSINIKNIIFSSTAAVYGNSENGIFNENSLIQPLSPYGWSKYFAEQILKDSYTAYGINSISLRYFNIAGNEENGLIGETNKEALNLIPSILLSHLKIRPFKFKIFGDNYKTRDGTAIRDYIHVTDLVAAHLKALEYLNSHNGSFTFNLGTGKGTTIMEIIKAFEKVTNEKLDYEITVKRPGDTAVCLADSSLAKKELNWEANLDIESMISSMWKWYKYNIK